MKNLKKYENLRLEEGDRQPKPIWAFLDVENLHVAWECYRGIIVHSLPPEPGKFFISSWVAPLFKDPNSPLTKNELKLEFLRQAEFPNKISRLRGIFYIEDNLSAENVIRQWGNSRNHFSADFLAELGPMENARFSKHDAKWISLMWENENPPEEWLRAYWNGDPCSIGPDNSIWELISESASVVWTRDLRERAYEEIKRYDEKCLGMLELARVAAELGYNLGHIQLFLKIKGSMLETSYIMNSAFDDPEFLKDFADYKGPKNTDDLNATALLTTPNLNWGNQALEIDPPVYQIMHAIMGN